MKFNFMSNRTAERIESKTDALDSKLVAIGTALNTLGHRLDRESDRRIIWERYMDARIQRAIDAITKLASMDDALKASVAAKDVEITDLRSQVAALQAKLDAGQTIDKGDLDALGSTIDNIADLNQADVAAVPANTDAAAAT